MFHSRYRTELIFSLVSVRKQKELKFPAIVCSYLVGKVMQYKAEEQCLRQFTRQLLSALFILELVFSDKTDRHTTVLLDSIEVTGLSIFSSLMKQTRLYKRTLN